MVVCFLGAKAIKAPPLTPLLASATLLEAAGRLAASMHTSESLEHLNWQHKSTTQQIEALQAKKASEQPTLQQKKTGQQLQAMPLPAKQETQDKAAFAQQKVSKCAICLHGLCSCCLCLVIIALQQDDLSTRRKKLQDTFGTMLSFLLQLLMRLAS